MDFTLILIEFAVEVNEIALPPSSPILFSEVPPAPPAPNTSAPDVIIISKLVTELSNSSAAVSVDVAPIIPSTKKFSLLVYLNYYSMKYQHHHQHQHLCHFAEQNNILQNF